MEKKLTNQKLVFGVPYPTDVSHGHSHYQVMISDFMASLEADERDCWLQQDRVMAHTAASMVEFLRETRAYSPQSMSHLW